MAYGTVKVDNITFTNGGIDQTVTVSGIVQSISGNITATGTIQAATIIGTSTVSGATVTGDAGQFTTATITSGVFASGTAAAPSISVGTTDNGIYSPGTYQVAISTSGTGRLFVDSSGNVGVGTTNPGHTLQVAGAVCATGSFGTASADTITLDTTGGQGRIMTTGPAIGGYNSLIFSQVNSSGGGYTERARIDSSGRLLVGTSTGPSDSTLVLQGNSSNATFNSVLRMLRDVTNPAGDTALGSIVFGVSSTAGAVIEGYTDAQWGSGDYPGRLVFSTTADGASSPTPRMTIDSSGRVGVGTTSPSSIATGYGVVHVSGSNGGGVVLGSSGYVAGSSSGVEFGTTTSNPVSFFSNNAERARIDSSGRLLVGTSTSINNVLQGGVQIVGTGADAYLTLTRFDTIVSAPAGIILGRSKSGTKGTNTAVADGDFLGVLEFTGADGGSSYRSAAQIAAYVDGAVSGGGAADMPGRLVFSTTADGTSSPTPRMTIGANGAVAIGTTNTATGYMLNIDSANGLRVGGWGAGIGVGAEWNTTVSTTSTAISFSYLTTEVGKITTTSTATAYVTSSDYRLKENVTAVTDGIIRLQQLKPSRFNFIADPTKTVDGFIAHEVQTIVPEAIAGEKDAVDDDGNPVYQGIDQSKLVPLLTAALQEAVTKIESLEARLTAAGI